MKKVLSIMMVAMFAMAMVSCEKDDPEDNPGGNSISGEGSVSITIDETRVDQGLGVVTWHIDLNNMNLRTFTEGGKTYSFGICYVEDGTPQYSDQADPDSWTGLESVNNDSTRLNFTSYCWVYPRKVARLFVYLSDGQFHYSEPFVLDLPANPDQGDLGIGTADLVESTESSITVTAHITGSVDNYLWQYPNYSCGFIWSTSGTPTMNSNVIDKGHSEYFEATISGLGAGTECSVAAWLKLTPDSQPIISDVRTYSPRQDK